MPEYGDFCAGEMMAAREMLKMMRFEVRRNDPSS